METSNGQSNGRAPRSRPLPEQRSDGPARAIVELRRCSACRPGRQDTHAHTSMLPFGAHRIAVGGGGRRRIFIVLVPPSPVRCRQTRAGDRSTRQHCRAYALNGCGCVNSSGDSIPRPRHCTSPDERHSELRADASLSQETSTQRKDRGCPSL